MTKPLAFLSFCFYSGILIFSKPPLKVSQSKPIYLSPPAAIKHFSFGFSDLYADILWLRLIQDIDYCGPEAGIPVYDGKTKYKCEKGWSYKMADAITELAPKFAKPYKVAGSIMSVIMNDKEGAKKIYDKGMRRHPNDWRLHFNAGYHYLFELEDEKKAAQILKKAADSGGPQWLYSLVASQYKKEGKYFLARKILLDFLKKDKAGIYKKAIEKKLSDLEREMRRMKISF